MLQVCRMDTSSSHFMASNTFVSRSCPVWSFHGYTRHSRSRPTCGITQSFYLSMGARNTRSPPLSPSCYVMSGLALSTLRMPYPPRTAFVLNDSRFREGPRIEEPDNSRSYATRISMSRLSLRLMSKQYHGDRPSSVVAPAP